LQTPDPGSTLLLPLVQPFPVQMDGENGRTEPQCTYAEVVAAPLKQLQEAEYVDVRHSQVDGPSMMLYGGPYKVTDRWSKVFDVQVGSCVESFSVEAAL
jgi:hypothetical protein